MPDVVIIGGGVIGLSTAYELAGRGTTVAVLEAHEPGREASWAGAGILPPAHPGNPDHPLGPLCRATFDRWPLLSAELRELTGIDNGFRRCGGIGVQGAGISSDEFRQEIAAWERAGVRVEQLSPSDLEQYEPDLNRDLPAYLLRDQCQVRNPRHLKALQAGCHRRGVVIHPGQPVVELDRVGDRIRAALTPTDRFEAGSFLVTAGAWSQQFLTCLGVSVCVVPIRGQIVLLNVSAPVLAHIIESGPRYLVPRPDGRILIGSTEERVGFNKGNTAASLRSLLEFGESLVPSLASAKFEHAWSGLRPHAPQGVPYLGKVPDYQNLYIAAGHFRGGLNLSPITASVMTQVILGESPVVPLDAFRVDR